MISDEDLAHLAARVIARNEAAGRMVALAESCTGGMVAAALTSAPGSATIFHGGYVTYANDAKQSMLGVSSEILDTVGAVSAACAEAMALGVIDRTGADVAVSITGIAGPTGGSAEKPIGTVIFGRAYKGAPRDSVESYHHRFNPSTGRTGIRRQAVAVALELLLPAP